MRLTNLSAEPLGKLYSWIPSGLDADEIVFLPDACPGKSPLPTGTAVLTRQPDWRRFAVSDCGCGMRLLRSNLNKADIEKESWSHLANLLRRNKGGLGDLGGGNHFLDALHSPEEDQIYFLIHTGSRNESGHVDAWIHVAHRFDEEFHRVAQWAEANRSAVQNVIEAVYGPVDLIIDAPHNTFEVLSDGATLIRKGSVKVLPGDLAVIPSHMSGDVAVGRATPQVAASLNSLSHGTGRAMSRSDCKPLADSFDFQEMRKRVLLPEGLEDSSLRTDGPYAYRDLDECLALLAGYFSIEQRLSVVAYMGHL